MTARRTAPHAIDLDFLKQEFNKFRAEVAGMKDNFSGSAAETLDKISAYLDGENLATCFAGLESQFEALGSKLKDTGKDAVSRIEQKFVERPVTSVAIAFGIGLLAAQFLRRR